MQYDFNKVAGKIINRQELTDAVDKHKQEKYSGFAGKLRKAGEIAALPYTFFVDLTNGLKAILGGIDDPAPSIYVTKDKVEEFKALQGESLRIPAAFPKEHLYADASQLLKFLEKAKPRDFNNAARIVESLTDYRAKAASGDIVPPKPAAPKPGLAA